MKIEFENKDYIEIVKSQTPGRVIITITARDYSNKFATISNSVELTEEQFNQLIKL